ncbi:hypothetical protein IHE44_0005686 [Lamprotornis superbus]|uniref:18S rRNA (pseudouridine(1248)-N1)-methyltransferase n=1 Tax=Lamprotornis superbus TaxID=245042 RepID=A0A835NNS6_9PASS|nr:hypothetical protein IHE44_0005686 [Lamprotornis superbus]
MAAPRRPRGDVQEEEDDEGRSLQGKRFRGQRRLLVVLEGASLETVKVGKTFELLNCDKHKALLLRNGRDPGEVRPDITHQSLLMLMDSPLNRAGLLQVYIHTKKNVLIEVNPQTRIPRTFDRFCGLMVQLLHKLSVRAADGPQKLLKVIKNPVSDHLPVGCMKIGTSFAVSQVSDLRELVPAAEPVVIVVGAFAHGSVNVDYTEKMVSISNYPLSAALTCAKITTAFEEVWGVKSQKVAPIQRSTCHECGTIIWYQRRDECRPRGGRDKATDRRPTRMQTPSYQKMHKKGTRGRSLVKRTTEMEGKDKLSFLATAVWENNGPLHKAQKFGLTNFYVEFKMIVSSVSCIYPSREQCFAQFDLTHHKLSQAEIRLVQTTVTTPPNAFTTKVSLSICRDLHR